MSAHISRLHVVANFVLFQLGWLACVLGGASERPWLGPLFVVLFVAWHLHVALRPHRELVRLPWLLVSAPRGTACWWLWGGCATRRVY